MTSRAGRAAGATALALLVVLCTAAPAVAATDYQLIETGGPIESIAVGNELSCQVAYVNDVELEFYPPHTTPGDCGTLLAVNGVLYAPDFSSHGISATWGLDGYVPFTPVSQTGVEGTGAAKDPYRVTTVVEAGGSGLRVSETTSYVSGSNSYRIDTAVTNTNPGGGNLNPVLYHAGDCYASGSDIGFGFTRSEVSTAGCSQTAQNSPPGRTIQMAPLSAGSSYFEARYDEVWTQIATQNPLPNTCRCGEHIDNGVGLSWELSVRPEGGGTVRSLNVSFTESTPPDPGADSDGDALPDNWETGGAPSGGYENLAPLGADPNRKDVFVHLDYKESCAPPKGWELPAIEVFRNHGIALHVDSGRDSINADGQPWGDRSLAGEIKVDDDIELWDAFDRLKDERFVPSNRRRAFHYAAIVKQFNGREGGKARDIPEADFILSGCRFDGWSEVKWKKYVTTTFVHELGHNLGLRHGGGDDVNGKPNYYGIMNYTWAWVFGVGKGGELKDSLPEYSWYARPTIDERHVSEREPQILPVAWNCPDDGRLRYEVGPGTRLIDWDCDGDRGELFARELNLNSGFDGDIQRLTGFNDWRPGVMRFDGGGVLGDFYLPERPSPAVTHELTPEEFVAAQKVFQRSRRQARRLLLVDASRERLRAGRAVTLRVGVKTAAGKGRRVRGALIGVRGAKLLPLRKRKGVRPRAPRRVLTGRRGKARLRLVPKRRGNVRIFATRSGFTRGGLVIPVRRKR